LGFRSVRCAAAGAWCRVYRHARHTYAHMAPSCSCASCAAAAPRLALRCALPESAIGGFQAPWVCARGVMYRHALARVMQSGGNVWFLFPKRRNGGGGGYVWPCLCRRVARRRRPRKELGGCWSAICPEVPVIASDLMRRVASEARFRRVRFPEVGFCPESGTISIDTERDGSHPRLGKTKQVASKDATCAVCPCDPRIWPATTTPSLCLQQATVNVPCCHSMPR
jgi:hypothetical protein